MEEKEKKKEEVAFENISPDSKFARHPPTEKQMIIRFPQKLADRLHEKLKNPFDQPIQVDFISNYVNYFYFLKIQTRINQHKGGQTYLLRGEYILPFFWTSQL